MMSHPIIVVVSIIVTKLAKLAFLCLLYVFVCKTNIAFDDYYTFVDANQESSSICRYNKNHNNTTIGSPSFEDDEVDVATVLLSTIPAVVSESLLRSLRRSLLVGAFLVCSIMDMLIIYVAPTIVTAIKTM